MMGRRFLSLFSSALKRLLAGATAICTLGYVIIVAAEVLLRYGFGNSQAWTYELAVYLFVASVFFGTALGCADRSHLSMDIFTESFGPNVKLWLRRLHDLLVIPLLAVITYYGYRYAQLGMSRNSTTMNFSLFWVYLTIPVSTAASILFLIENHFSGDQ